MRKISTRFTILAGCVAAIAALVATMAGGAAASTTCTQTGFMRDGMNLTAAVINPTAPVTGEVDATGCNIGVYYGPGTSGGSVTGANIHGANYYGVVVNAAAANVTNSSIHDIGEGPLNGVQHGVGVFYTTLNQDGVTSTGAAATGTVSGNTFTSYQKGGIVVNGPGAAATISGNTVTGQGPVDYIAQNGIQLGRGATGTVSDNKVTGNAYKGLNGASSCAILVFGGGSDALTTGVSISHNTLTNNDIGVYVYNTNLSGTTPPATKTNNSIVNNTITNSLGASNVSGNGSPNGYQAGITDLGNKDNIVNNKISGNGYDKSLEPTPGSVYTQLDLNGSTKPHVKNNG